MKKRLISLLLLCLLLPAAAFADVIWEPNDDFYWKNSEDCVHVNRQYIGNGKEGYVSFYSDPLKKSLLEAYPNGFRLTVHFSLSHGGREFGLVEFQEDELGIPVNAYGDSKTAWIDMAELSLVYDSKAFREEYAESIENREGTLLTGEKLCIYAYPGSVLSFTLEGADRSIGYSQCFVDEDGLEWAYIGYYQGIRDSWFCLSDPENGALPLRQREEKALIPPQTVPDEVFAEQVGSFLFPALLVFSVVALSLGLLFKMKNRRRG